MVAIKRGRIIDTDEVIKMGTRTKKPFPTHVIAWKLRVNTDLFTGDIDISYTKVWEFDLQTGEKIEDYLYEYARTPDKPRGNNPEEPEPHKSITNLSIRHKDDSYMVFILANKNLQFSESDEPFKVAKDNTTPENDAFYTDPLCAWIENGQPKKGRTAGPRCRVASFIANSADDQHHSGQDFYTSFNIYLDLRLKWKSDPRNERLLPIVIDPDVGHPGGSQP